MCTFDPAMVQLRPFSTLTTSLSSQLWPSLNEDFEVSLIGNFRLFLANSDKDFGSLMSTKFLSN